LVQKTPADITPVVHCNVGDYMMAKYGFKRPRVCQVSDRAWLVSPRRRTRGPPC
jgi:hypothetical protein